MKTNTDDSAEAPGVKSLTSEVESKVICSPSSQAASLQNSDSLIFSCVYVSHIWGIGVKLRLFHNLYLSTSYKSASKR